MAEIKEVTPIEGERWSFHVHSRSRPGLRHRVDLEAYNWNGACDCEDFNFNREPDLRRGAAAHDDWRCYHLRVARSFVMEEVFPMLAKAMGGPKMPTPGAGQSTLTRAKRSIKDIKDVGDLISLRNEITALIDEQIDHESDHPDSNPSRESQRPAPKVYNLQSRQYTR